MPPLPILTQRPDEKPLILIDNVVIAQPAAGAEIEIVIPVGIQFSLNSLRFMFVTDANVADRSIVLVAVTAAGEIFNVSHNTVITDNETRTVCAAPGLTTLQGGLANPHIWLSWPPDLVLEEGAQIRTITTNIQVGDQYSGIAFQARTQQFLET